MTYSSYNESSNGATGDNNVPELAETSTFVGYVNNDFKDSSYFYIPVNANDSVTFSFNGTGEDFEISLYYGTNLGDLTFIADGDGVGGNYIGTFGDNSTVETMSAPGFDKVTVPGAGYLFLQVYTDAAITQSFTLTMNGSGSSPPPPPPPPPGTPNLVFTAFSLSASSVTSGGTIDLHCTLKNEGSSSAAPSDVEIYFSTSATFNKSTATYGGQVSISTIAAGNSLVETIVDPNIGIAPGHYYVFLYESQNGAVSKGLPLTINAVAPDLVFTSFSLSPSSEAEHGDITLKYVLKNEGNVAVGASDVQVYYSTSPDFSTATSTPVTQSFNALAPGNAFAGTEVINGVPLPAGDYYFFLYVDDNGVTAHSSAEPLTILAPPLFTKNADKVDFNNLTDDQKAAIVLGANKYDGLGGSDTVILPSEANETEDVGSGEQLNWHDSVNSLFHTDSRVGDTYNVTGTDGDYWIDCGAGTDIINITNPDPASHTSYNTIITGSGKDTVTISGANGDNGITVGTGSPTINLEGTATTSCKCRAPLHPRSMAPSSPAPTRSSRTTARLPSSSSSMPRTVSTAGSRATANSTSSSDT